MSRPNPKKSLLFISLLSIIISLFLFIASITPQKQETSNKVHSDQFWKEEYWRNVIEKEGGEEAYQELKRQFANWAYLPTHQALHAFGFALYNKFGQKGSIYCDDYQRFGCFHGVIAAFIANKGLSALEDMDSVCPLNQPSAENRCFHGIGHGLVDYLGKPNLNQALVFCKKINSLTYLGCPQGPNMLFLSNGW